MKKSVFIAGAAAVVVGAAAFGVFKWQEHSKKVAKCQSYLDKMTQIYEQDIERTVSRLRRLYLKEQEGNLSESDALLLPLLASKYITEVSPALDDIFDVHAQMSITCQVKSMNKQGNKLLKKYNSVATSYDMPAWQLEQIEKPGESSHPLSDPGEAPEVTTKSSEFAILLSKHLKKVGAVMYTAYWCSDCHEQLELFGRPAIKNIETVECATDGKDSQAERCMKQAIEGFPSWSMPGHKSAGMKSLQELADLSGYQR